MEFIKFTLIKLHNSLVFQILDQKDMHINYTNNLSKIRISCSYHPEIGKSNDGWFYICLRGTDITKNYKACAYTFNSNTERDEVYNRIMNTFENLKLI